MKTNKIKKSFGVLGIVCTFCATSSLYSISVKIDDNQFEKTEVGYSYNVSNVKQDNISSLGLEDNQTITKEIVKKYIEDNKTLIYESKSILGYDYDVNLFVSPIEEVMYTVMSSPETSKEEKIDMIIDPYVDVYIKEYSSSNGYFALGYSIDTFVTSLNKFLNDDNYEELLAEFAIAYSNRVSRHSDRLDKDLVRNVFIRKFCMVSELPEEMEQKFKLSAIEKIYNAES